MSVYFSPAVCIFAQKVVTHTNDLIFQNDELFTIPLIIEHIITRAKPIQSINRHKIAFHSHVMLRRYSFWRHVETDLTRNRSDIRD